MESLHSICHDLIRAYKAGELGQTVMPEDTHPEFKSDEERLLYFTLPMALNYQRDSYKLWEAALETYNDEDTQFVFDLEKLSHSNVDDVRKALTKHKVALQPNKHVNTWIAVANSIHSNWGSVVSMLESADFDFLKLKQLIQTEKKKSFPYLSGPKIFNYWSFIISTHGGIKLINRDRIDIAPDTHITQCSLKLGVISSEESISLTKDEISERWRSLLAGSGIDPIDMHSPLWFWSRNGFIYNPKGPVL